MSLIVLDCEAPFGVGAPSVGDTTESGAVDVNGLRDGRVETFHGTDCSEDTGRQFRNWLDAGALWCSCQTIPARGSNRLVARSTISPSPPADPLPAISQSRREAPAHPRYRVF
jgi:hypothetical protein